MILALGARGRGFDSRNSPYEVFAFFLPQPVKNFLFANYCRYLLIMSDNSKKRAREVSTSAGSTGAQKKLKVGDFFDLKSMDPTAKRIIEARLLMHKREQARQENNFVRSDDLRERLNKIGVEVTDQKGGPSV